MRLGAGNGELLPVRGFSRATTMTARHVEAGQTWKVRQPVTPPPGSSMWRSHDGLYVISALERAKYPSGDGGGPQWHLSVALSPARRQAAAEEGLLARPTNADVARAATAFDMPAWEDDAHHPGIARHLWCPVDEARRVDCECKLEEATIVDADGYTWTNPHDPAECRGCEYEALMALHRVTAEQRALTRCPLHSQAS